MGFPCVPRTSRKLQKTVKNLKVSLLCFLLTFLMLRNTIGAGKFGTPAQDFEEIKQHLHFVGLHRRHFRVLAEAIEGGDAEKHVREASLSKSSPLQADAVRETPNTDQGNAALMVRQVTAPLSTARLSRRGSLSENAGLKKGLDGSRIDSLEREDRTIEGALVQRSDGGSRVLLLTGVHSSSCRNPAGERFLLKSLENKAQYSTAHGLEMSLSFGSKLSLLRGSLEKYPHEEWLWWLPQDALITNMDLQLPLQKYTDFNLVLFRSDGSAYHEHRNRLINLNRETFLIRNCQWSLDLLRASIESGSLGKDRRRRELTDSSVVMPHFDPTDQAPLIYVPEQDGKVYVERSAKISGNWRYVAEQVERVGKHPQRGNASKGLPLITQYVGCASCIRVHDKNDEICVKQAERTLALVGKQITQSRD